MAVTIAGVLLTKKLIYVIGGAAVLGAIGTYAASSWWSQPEEEEFTIGMSGLILISVAILLLYMLYKGRI